ncbi:acyltransferase family protein [Microbacterium sp. NPDC091313]
MSSNRLTSLDGLRGLAALVVLLYHSLLAVPVFAAAHSGEEIAPYLVPLANTPLHFLWAGREAVFVFFVLSGVVLTLPAARGSRPVWRSYYPSRLIRLYLPVIASVLFALALALTWSRAGASSTPWIASHDEVLTPWGVARDMLLVMGTSDLNSPLWSLQWEVIFSLLLPAYLLVTLRAKRLWWLTALLLAACVPIGQILSVGALVYLPLFGFGCLLAAHFDTLNRWIDRLESVTLGRWWRPIGLILAVLALTSDWWLTPLSAALGRLTLLAAYVGAVLLVVIAWRPGGLARVLNSRPFQILGTLSFSLYLIHEPIVVSFGVSMPANMTWLVPVLAIPTSLAVSWLFYRWVEAPAHRLAKRVGRATRPAQPLEPSLRA